MTLNPGDILVYDGNNWVNSSFTSYTKVVLTQPAPLVQTNGLLNLGEGGFAGGANAFLGSGSGTVLAINTGSSYGGRLCEFQVGGQSKFLVGAGGLCQVINFTATGNQLSFSSAPAANAALGMLSIGNGGFTGATPPNFSGSGSGTYLAMNAVSGYA